MLAKKFTALAGLLILVAGLAGGWGSAWAGSGQAGEVFASHGKLRGLFLQGDPEAEHRVLISYEGPPGTQDREFVHGQGGKVKHLYSLVPGLAATLPEAALEALERHPRVTLIEPDGRVWAVDAELDNSWGVKAIGAGLVHDAGNRGAAVKVAIIDSGIDYSHPDLAANYAGGYDFVNRDTQPLDDNGHGTHVAGIVAARDNGSGVVGVAPEARLYALKVLDSTGAGWWSDIIAALQWSVTNGIQVTNNSYGASSDSDGSAAPSLVRNAFDSAYQAGVLHVAASGNRTYPWDDASVQYPAKFTSVIAVGATDAANRLASFSCYGAEMELTAPGVSITSTLPGGKYSFMSGTSMASPHVAGAAALVIASGVANPVQVRQRLQQTADDLGSIGWDEAFGFGLVDADGAAGTITPPPSPSEPPAAGGMHIGDLDGGKTLLVRYWQGYVTIRVHDQNHQPVASALVKGTFSGAFNRTVQAYTNSLGACTLTTVKIPKSQTNLTFTVNSVSKFGLTYTPNDNHDPDGDSNGTTINISGSSGDSGGSLPTYPVRRLSDQGSEPH